MCKYVAWSKGQSSSVFDLYIVHDIVIVFYLCPKNESDVQFLELPC